MRMCESVSEKGGGGVIRKAGLWLFCYICYNCGLGQVI